MSTKTTQPLVLLTGATGFLGATIARLLRCDTIRLRTTGRRKLDDPEMGEYLAADLTQSDDVSNLVRGVNTIIHSAGLIYGHGVAKHHDDAYWRVNTRGTEILARAAIAAGCKRFIFVSSISVYGQAAPPFLETTCCCPLNVYAKSKLAAEQLLCRMANEFAMEVIILRMAPICGEGARGNVERLIRAIDRGRFVWVGDGGNVKSLIHVEDAARACRAAACGPGTTGGIYNISAPACTMREIVGAVTDSLGRRVSSFRLPARLPLKICSGARRLPVMGSPAMRAHAMLEKWLSDEVYASGLFEQSFEWKAEINVRDALTRQTRDYRNRLAKSA